MFIDIHTHNSQLAQEIISLRSFRFGIEPIEWGAYTCAAIHPWDTNIALDQNYEAIIPNLFAISEIGLDSLHPNIEQQTILFKSQLKLAIKYTKTVIIHTVKSHNETIEILRNHHHHKIIHSFTGNYTIANQYTTTGCYLSFSPQSLKSQKTVDALKLCPITNIFIESDTSSQPIEQTYAKVAEIKSCSITELKNQIYNNFNTIFYEY